MTQFEHINKGYNNVFKPGQLSVGLVVPIENYAKGPIPTMQHHLQRVQAIDQLGFKALWVRDIPFHVPSFGDAGQTYDPFTYLGFLAGLTQNIALGVASVALPLHHPLHVAKQAATVDQLSGGRLLLGVATGDRYEEYPAMGTDYENRDELFREAFTYIRQAQEPFPHISTNHFGQTNGHIDVLPKPAAHKIPMLLTGYSRQSLEWNAEHSDGWMSYPKNLLQQQHSIAQWRALVKQSQAQKQGYDKPFMQPLYVVLQHNDDYKPRPIPLGFQLGANYLVEYLQQIRDIGVNHVAINLRFNEADMQDTLEALATKVLPQLHTTQQEYIPA